VLPIFPLSLVQFPGALTPLHIFEPRYRKLLSDIRLTDKTFGITYRPDGPDPVAAAPPRGRVGCSVEVIAVQELPDGRSNILCAGGVRYRTLAYVEGEPYLQAEVELFADEPVDEDLAPETERATALFQRVLAASKTLKDSSERADAEEPELPAEAQALSFIIASSLDISLDEKQELLELVRTGERLRRVNALLADLATSYEHRARIHLLSRGNGHGGALPR
jgi:Lon protease-like protein